MYTRKSKPLLKLPIFCLNEPLEDPSPKSSFEYSGDGYIVSTNMVVGRYPSGRSTAKFASLGTISGVLCAGYFIGDVNIIYNTGDRYKGAIDSYARPNGKGTFWVEDKVITGVFNQGYLNKVESGNQANVKYRIYKTNVIEIDGQILDNKGTYNAQISIDQKPWLKGNFKQGNSGILLHGICQIWDGEKFGSEIQFINGSPSSYEGTFTNLLLTPNKMIGRWDENSNFEGEVEFADSQGRFVGKADGTLLMLDGVLFHQNPYSDDDEFLVYNGTITYGRPNIGTGRFLTQISKILLTGVFEGNVGNGEILFPSKDVFVGSWTRMLFPLKNSVGRIIYSDGRSFKGKFANQGFPISYSGFFRNPFFGYDYEGTWENGIGCGTMKISESLEIRNIERITEYGYPEGHLEVFRNSILSFSGCFTSYDNITGSGHFSTKIFNGFGDDYFGAWNSDHGIGKIIIGNISVYYGRWDNVGKPEGYGVMFSALGDFARGSWVRGKLHKGKGTLVSLEKGRESGEWKNGTREDKYKLSTEIDNGVERALKIGMVGANGKKYKQWVVIREDNCLGTETFDDNGELFQKVWFKS